MSVQVITNKYFEFTMLGLICMSSLELCFDDATVIRGSPKGQALHAMDIFFTAAFGIEVRALFLVTLFACG